MGELALKHAKAQKSKGGGEPDGRKSDRAREDGLLPEEKQALRQLQKGAKAAHSVLASGGKGGLSPLLAKACFERCKFRCKVCGKKGKENNALTLHHVGGIVTSEKTSKLGHRNIEKNIIAVCEKCHNRLHEEARREGEDSSQVTPEADKGTKRDHGLPDPDV